MHLHPGMLVSDVRVDLRGLLTAHLAVGTLVARLEAALVGVVSLQIAFEGETTAAARTVMLLLAGTTAELAAPATTRSLVLTGHRGSVDKIVETRHHEA